MRTGSRVFLRIFGAATFAVAIGYVFFAVKKTFHSPLWNLTPALWLTVGCSLLLYGVSLSILSLSWGYAVAESSGTGLRIAFYNHGITTIFKYLPGNVAHYFARQAYCRGDAKFQAKALWASLLEACCQIAVTSLIAMPVIGVVQNRFAGGMNLRASWPLLLAGGGMAAFLFHKSRDLMLRTARFTAVRLKIVFIAFGANFLFFTGSGALFLFVAIREAEIPLSFQQDLSLIGLYSCAWLAGFLMPGAPAGLGVRDALLIVFISPIVGPESSAVFVVLFRLIQIGGDFLYWIVVLLAGRIWIRH